VHAGLRRMIDVRRRTPAFGGGRLTGFRSGSPHVLGYVRGEGAQRVLVLANFSEQAQALHPVVFSAGQDEALDLLTQRPLRLHRGALLAPYEVLWLHWPQSR
jgi:amylosucrase